MASAYPAGGTFFDTLKKSFTDVPVDASKDNAISTTEFLDAAESLTTLFGRDIQYTPYLSLEDISLTDDIDVLGGAAFKPVKSDMIGNVKKIRDRQLAAPTVSDTLQNLVINELKEGKHVATEGLLWLSRSVPINPPSLFTR